MLKTNNIIRNGITYTKTYSDAGYYIMRDDVSYEEAIDPLGFRQVLHRNG